MRDLELVRINEERLRRGLPPLTKQQAMEAMVKADDRYDSGFDSFSFLIAYQTGIPMPGSGGWLGALMHPHRAADSVDSAPSFGAASPSYAPPTSSYEPPAPSYPVEPASAPEPAPTHEDYHSEPSPSYSAPDPSPSYDSSSSSSSDISSSSSGSSE